MPVLVVVRGNSASGKSSLADAVRSTYGRGVALVGQDVLRRQVLRELPVPGGANISLIDLVARHALAHGFHTVVEGILEAAVYGPMLSRLVADHRAGGGTARAYYLDVSLPETLRRHTGKPIADEVTAEHLTRWYLPRDLIAGLDETVFDESLDLDAMLAKVFADTGLLDSPLRATHAHWDRPDAAPRWR